MARADRFQAISSCHECSSQYQAVTQRVPQAAQTGDRPATIWDPTQLGLAPLGQIQNDPLGIAVNGTSVNRLSFDPQRFVSVSTSTQPLLPLSCITRSLTSCSLLGYRRG
ncbi:hypothetical protein BJX62DRAFT_69605 [Aspergillus germanicus]